MRIVDRATFLSLPAGTVFAKFEPHVFGEVTIKEQTVGNDFVEQGLLPWFEGVDDSGAYFDTLETMVAGAPSPPLDYDCAGRDGLFDLDQLFAVFEERDVEALVARLQQALSAGYGRTYQERKSNGQV